MRVLPEIAVLITCKYLIEPATPKPSMDFSRNEIVALPFRPFISHEVAAAAGGEEESPAASLRRLSPFPLKWHLKPSLATYAACGHQSPTSSSHCGMERGGGGGGAGPMPPPPPSEDRTAL